METIIDRVVAAAGRYEGRGDGAGRGPFTATIDIDPLLEGMGAQIGFVAVDATGVVLHSEHTVLAFDMWSGEPTLFVLCAELSGLGRLPLIGASTFSNGAGAEGFEVQIDIGIDGTSLEYVWSSGAPGEPLVERWRAVAQRSR